MVYEDEDTKEIRCIEGESFLGQAAYKDIENMFGDKIREQCEKNSEEKVSHDFTNLSINTIENFNDIHDNRVGEKKFNSVKNDLNIEGYVLIPNNNKYNEYTLYNKTITNHDRGWFNSNVVPVADMKCIGRYVQIQLI